MMEVQQAEGRQKRNEAVGVYPLTAADISDIKPLIFQGWLRMGCR